MGQIANFWEKNPQVYLIIIRNLDNFPPGAFYSSPHPLQLGTEEYLNAYRDQTAVLKFSEGATFLTFSKFVVTIKVLNFAIFGRFREILYPLKVSKPNTFRV